VLGLAVATPPLNLPHSDGTLPRKLAAGVLRILHRAATTLRRNFLFSGLQ
jgi:hypothetical protein